MTDPLRRCPDHGPFGGDRCPDCGASGDPVLDADRRERLSRFLSGALRHFPDDADLDLDRHGWADWDALVAAATDRYAWADSGDVAAVVAADPEGRFERRDGEVRASYGHSVDVTLPEGDEAVPATLYHGTAPDRLDAILGEGLQPMSRQAVHLSGSREGALTVGERHASNPALLAVDAAGLTDAGVAVTRRGTDTYTASEVPPQFLAVERDPRDEQ
ncbi:MAG: RNA 2'-phosphotransferase [Halobacteriaceae archaeon]